MEERAAGALAVEQAPLVDMVPPWTGGARVRLVLILGALIALGPLTIDMYLPALPAITTDLVTTEAAVQLTLTGTLLGLAVGQLVVGPLADAFGRKRPLLVGAGVHVGASVLCAVAPNIAVLGGLRVLQGAGAAAGIVVALAIVRDLYTGRAAAKLLSQLLAGTAAGLLLLVASFTGFGGLVGVLVPLWAVLFTVGLALPNAPALALSRHGEAAGTAAALLGAVQFRIGAIPVAAGRCRGQRRHRDGRHRGNRDGTGPGGAGARGAAVAARRSQCSGTRRRPVAAAKPEAWHGGAVPASR